MRRLFTVALRALECAFEGALAVAAAIGSRPMPTPPWLDPMRSDIDADINETFGESWRSSTGGWS